MPEDVKELQSLINAEALALTAVTIMLTKNPNRDTQALLEECKQIHMSRKDKLIRASGENVTEISLSMPPDMESALLSSHGPSKALIEYLAELEQSLLDSYNVQRPQIQKPASKDLAAQLIKDQEKLCTRINVESQSITHVMEHRKRPTNP